MMSLPILSVTIDHFCFVGTVPKGPSSNDSIAWRSLFLKILTIIPKEYTAPLTDKIPV